MRDAAALCLKKVVDGAVLELMDGGKRGNYERKKGVIGVEVKRHTEEGRRRMRSRD